MNELEELEELHAAHSSAGNDFLDTNLAVKAALAYQSSCTRDLAHAADIDLARHNVEVAIIARNSARTRMFNAAQALDSAIDCKED